MRALSDASSRPSGAAGVARIWHLARAMPVTVCSCVTYCPAFGPRTEDSWTALYFVNAIKRTPLAGSAHLQLPSGDIVSINRGSAGAATEWFAQLAIAATPWRDILPCGLVAIPDADCSLAAGRPSRTHCLADALASRLGPEAAPVDLLRWVRPMLPAHLVEDSRDPQVLYGRLRLRDPLQRVQGQRIVLVDDVIASGAHVRAAAAFLRDGGATIVRAICAAQACYTRPVKGSFVSASTQILSDFYSDPDWRLPELYDGVEL